MSRMTAVAASLAFALAFVGDVSAQSGYPQRPIRLIVPYAPGGAVDAVGRILAQDLSMRLGQQVVVDNRAGGGGILGFEIAARAVPDGYTLLIGSVGLASMPGLYRKLPFDPLRDFTLSASLSRGRTCSARTQASVFLPSKN